MAEMIDTLVTTFSNSFIPAIIIDTQSIPLLVGLVIWRLVIPILLGHYAQKKGYFGMLVACIGVFASTLVAAGFAFLLPDKNESGDNPPTEE